MIKEKELLEDFYHRLDFLQKILVTWGCLAGSDSGGMTLDLVVVISSTSLGVEIA